MWHKIFERHRVFRSTRLPCFPKIPSSGESIVHIYVQYSTGMIRSKNKEGYDFNLISGNSDLQSVCTLQVPMRMD